MRRRTQHSWNITSTENQCFPAYTGGIRPGIMRSMNISTMEPMLPEAAERSLEDAAVTPISEASMLADRVHP
jgi:hypothetical protein